MRNLCAAHLEELAMESKGFLQSKTVLSILGLVGLNITTLVAFLSDKMPIIQDLLLKITPDQFDFIIVPILAIVSGLLNIFLAARGVKGRVEAKGDLSGLWQKKG